ncbi:hypothetical protein NCM_05419 [Burkholderia pseudomallei]
MPLIAAVSSFLSSTGSTYSRLICPNTSAKSRNWSSGSGAAAVVTACWADAEICSVAKTPVARPAAIRPMFFNFIRIESGAVGKRVAVAGATGR